MVELPEFLKFYQQSAEIAWKNHAIRDLEFSGPTYQVQVKDPHTKRKEWAFLQLDEKGQIKDCFCSCMGEEENPGCLHLSVAFLGIYGKHHEPLHQRFERSLWNQLCRGCAMQVGYSSDVMTKVDDTLYVGSKDADVWVKLEFLSAEVQTRWHQILDSPLDETEETSLKFSNLTQEELMQWRSGQPSLGLSYVLSFWSDLAKWLMEMQELELSYTIDFQGITGEIPGGISIQFQEVHLYFKLSKDILELIIPALNTVHSPLKVFSLPEEAIDQIEFDDQKGTMEIHIAENGSWIKKNGIHFHEWMYFPSEGFYALTPAHLFPAKKLHGEQIAQALDNHHAFIKSRLKKVQLEATPHSLSYTFQFDTHWNLHIEAHLFERGDLSKSGSWIFGDWIFLKAQGFFRIEGKFFEEMHVVVAKNDMNDFVSQYRVWLNMQPGFEVHLTGKEPRLGYILDDDNRLHFFKSVEGEKGVIRGCDFGAWVYLEAEGFYPKAEASALIAAHPGLSISAEQLPLFIRMNQDELHLIPRFFSDSCPVAKCGLEISVNDDQEVMISPKYEYTKGYQPENVRIFEGFSFVEGEGFYELTGERFLPEKYRFPFVVESKRQAEFFSEEWESVKKYAWTIDPKLGVPRYQSLVILNLIKKEVLERGWYVLKLAYQTDKGMVDIPTFWRALKNNQRYLFTDAGRFDLLEKRYEWLRIFDKKRIDLRSRSMAMTALELIRLQILEDVNLSHLDKASLSVLQELLYFHPREFPDLPQLKCQLRSYQQVGVLWLWFLYQHHLSGFICDDMGLGKTHQAMALMAMIQESLAKQKNKIQAKFLIICPTSVIYHWQEKMAIFLPSAKVFTFYGSGRRLEDFDEQYEVMLTSYGVWRNEQKVLTKVPFTVVFFDEVQIAKNHTSQIYSSLMHVKAEMRIGLTGTPIENHLRELKALFDIVVPTYMPNDASFREFFIKPIENQGSVERKQLLSRFVKPFIIRRKKEDVLLDLPEKTEEISHCTLVDDQKHLYVEVLERSREKILQVLHDRTIAIPYMHIFALLSSLKQICNHPAAFLKTPEEYQDYSSGKWDLFKELLDEARESSQKVVVFSQYLGMLDIFELYLQQNGIEYATIRGSTVDRRAPIKRFNQDPNCEIFVGSLRAAGLGIDLTAASVVIHYDRWWNAARENQATDRVHRMGQTRGVQVFKLVTLGTIEERIDQLISQKGQLLEDVVGVDEQQVLKQFNREELIQLLQFIDLG